MKVFIQGKKAVSLSQNDFIAKGGEGSVYGKGNTIFKIYVTPAKMIPDGKIRELQALDRPNILRPLDVLLDPKNTPVGFTMKWVRETVPLCKFFTNDFRSRNGFTDPMAVDLVENIRDTVRFIHQARCLMVDGNEFNYLVSLKDMKTPFFIDVDSYQTPGFPATAIMPSIRDWQSRHLSELTDWFAFAVIACQIYVGIHPFKGRHAKFKKNDIESRMKANVSIFNPEVKIPPAVRDFNRIPQLHLAWFLDIFEKGQRSPPPDLPGKMMTGVTVAVPTPAVQVPGVNPVEIEPLGTYGKQILWHRLYAGKRMVGLEQSIVLDQREYPVMPGAEIVLTPKRLIPVIAWIKDGFLKLRCEGASMPPFPQMQADDIRVIENTLFVRHRGALTEIAFEEIGTQVLPTVKNIWEIMPHASEVFDGVIYQNVLGKPYLVIPQPKKDGNSACIVRPVPGLEECRVLDAAHRSGVCIIIGHKDNQYHRWVFRFGREYQQYDVRVTSGIDPNTVNFVVLDKGVAVSVNEDGEMEVFPAAPFKPDVNTIRSPDIRSDMRLCREGNTVMFFRNRKLYRMRSG